jgi:nucleoside-diphosphate-sugar epimerase
VRVLVIGGTGFIGAHIVRQIASHEHTVAVYHRGLTQAALPGSVQHIIDPRSVMPIQHFPDELFEFQPDVVILTVAMGALDAHAAVESVRRTSRPHRSLEQRGRLLGIRAIYWN